MASDGSEGRLVCRINSSAMLVIKPSNSALSESLPADRQAFSNCFLANWTYGSIALSDTIGWASRIAPNEIVS